MRLVTAAEMREIEERAEAEYGLTKAIMMENAGRATAQVASMLLEGLRGRRLLVLAGKGNNGGDGFVAARYLLLQGAKVRVFLLAPPEELRGEAARNWRLFCHCGGEVSPLTVQDLPKLRALLPVTDLVVDALLGTGVSGPPRGLVAEIITLLNSGGAPVLAVDLPSGLEADTGAGACVHARATVTFGFPKVGLFLYPGARWRGRLFCAEIGLPPLEDEGRVLLVSPEWVRTHLPQRPPDAHKGLAGRVLLVGGSPGLTGAAALAAEAALRAGAGLVTLGTPASLQPLLAAKLTEVMTRALPEEGGLVGREAAEAVLSLGQGVDALGLGPGLGQGPSVVAAVEGLLARWPGPLVLDADGLNALATLGPQAAEARVFREGRAILTPHPGELARLLGSTAAQIQQDRLGAARRAAATWGAVVVLKGAYTVIAAPDGRVWLNPTGNAGMASGGMGDVLTGVLTALLPQVGDPLRTAALGVWLHGLAGDLAADTLGGEQGIAARDVIAALPRAMALAREGWVARPALEQVW